MIKSSTMQKSSGKFTASGLAKQSKLYGRNEEIGQLLEAFERVNRGRGEVLLLPGLSGTGKTALANVLREPTRSHNGFFLEGKFNQYDQNVAYVAWRQALSEFCSLIRREEVEQQRKWAEKIMAAVGGHGQLLIDLVPDFEFLLGKQSQVDTISPAESRHRFARVIRDTLSVLSKPEHPLVLFIDDWQWADPASHDLLAELQIDSTLRYVLLVAAYRSDEVNDQHRFASTVEDLRNRNVPVSSTKVENLTLAELEKLVKDATPRFNACDLQLVRTIHKTTGGNAFFSHALLDDLLSAFKENHSAQTATDKHSTYTYPLDVIEVFERRIDRLLDSTQGLLSLAACLGNRFDVETLAMISDRSASECQRELAAAQDLLVPVMETVVDEESARTFRFSHDRVQQAAHSRLDSEQLPAIRLEIARSMMLHLSPEELKERATEVAEHFNAGSALVDSPDEVFQGVQLNLYAARKARNATAFSTALEQHRAAHRLIESRSTFQYFWEEHFELTSALFLEHAETEFLEGEKERAENLIRLAVEETKTPVQKAEALATLIVQKTLQARYNEAIQAGRQALSALGMELPDDDYETHCEAEIAKARQRLTGREIQDIVSQPVASDEVMRTASKVLITMGPPCYRAHQRLWSVIVPRVVNLTLEHGPIPQVGYSHTALAGLLGWVSSDFESGRTLCEVAYQLMNTSLATSSDLSVYHLMMGSSARHWNHHLAESSRDYESAIEAGRASGNLQYAAYAFGHNMYCRFFQGVALDELIGETESSLAFSKTRHNQWAIDLLRGGLRVFRELRGQSPEQQAAAESAYLEEIESHKNQQVACIYHVMQAQKSIILGELENAFERLELAAPLIFTVGTQGLLPWPEYVFTRAMTLAGLALKKVDEGPTLRVDELQELVDQLRVWADQCPDNFEHKYLLASAALAKLQGRRFEAIEQCEQASRAASKNGFSQWEALANEWAADFWSEFGNGRLEQIHWQRSYDCYQRWGAQAKLVVMTAKYHQNFVEAAEAIRASDVPTSQSSNELGRQFADRQVEILQERAARESNARGHAQALVTVEELATAADSLRVDVAAGRRTASLLRDQRDAEQALNQELERRVKRRTSDLEQTALELRQANSALEQMEKRFRATVESAPIAMVMLDESGRIVLVNAELENLFGYFRDELLGNSVDLLVPSRFLDQIPDLLNSYLSSPHLRQIQNGSELSGLRKDGTEIPLELGINPVKTDEGVFVLCAIVDITERKNAEVQMRRANATLEQSNKELEQFAYVASHDLQEPLRKIASYCQLLEEEQSHRMDDDGKEYLKVAIKGAQRLQTLVHDLLTFSRITTRGKALSATNASSSLDEAVSNLSLLIEEKGAKITADCLPIVHADAGQLTHLFQNLVTNAIKYCERSTPEIHVGAKDLGSEVEVFVRDNGIGIEDQFHERIFQVFQRLHNRRKYSGTGIGLALCKRIVERFGGEIRVESTPGEGSTFYFTLNKAQ